MKRIIMFLLLFAALKVAGQTTGYLRFDTVKIMKQNGTCELYVINKTKDSLGVLTNVGGGLTRFIKSKVLNDSTVVIGLDTLVIPGATGGGATLTLNNVGTGLRRVTTPNGSIKTDIYGYGVNGDSTTNANSITVVADTSELVTPSDLNDAIAAASIDTTSLSNRINQKSVITQLEGIIYSKSSWSNISDFTTRGTTPTVSSSAIAFSGGANNFSQTIDLDTTMRERWVMHIEQKVGTVSSTSDGLGIGVRSVNPNAAYGVAGILVTNNTGNGGKLLLIDTYNSSVIATSTSSIPFSAADTVVFELERDRLWLTLKGWNKTTGSDIISVQYLYSLSESPSHVLPNIGTFSVFNVGGSQSMTALTVNSKETKNAPLFIAADSKAWYYAGTNSWGMLLDKIFRPTNAHAGPADRLIELLATEDELIALSPANLAISIGSNDIGSGYSVGQTFTRYKQYVARAEAAGINVFHLLPLYQPTIVSELDSLADSIRITYPTKIIDCRTPARRNPSFFLASDNVHPNEEYNTLIYNTIINSGVLKSYYKTPNSTAASLDEVLTVGNSSSQAVDLNGVSTNSPKLKVGPLEVQPYSLNNVWVGENTYYNGSDWKYRSNGFAERFHFQNGYIFFETAPSGSAGGNVTWKLNMLGDYNGNIGLGGMDPNSPTHANAFMNIDGTSGKVSINGNSLVDSKLKVGTLEISSHADNNASVADNAYYDNNASSWKRRLTGGASMLHLQNGTAYISNVGSSSAGSNITWVNSIVADESGNVGLGNMPTLNYADASVYIPVGTGYLHLENVDSTATPANMIYRDPITKALKMAAVPSGGGITSINGETGPAFSIYAGTGIIASTASNATTIEVNTASNALPHTLDKHYTAANNSGTSETDLFSYTQTGASAILNTDGQSIHFETVGTFNDATATVALQFYFAGTSFGNTGALALSGTGKWRAQGYILRTSSSTANAYVIVSCDKLPTASYVYEADLTGIDFTGSNILKVTGQAGGGGGGSNDITQKSWVVSYQPL